MVQLPHRFAHGRDDLRMRMPQDRAHLAGGEIQHPAARRVVQERSFGAHRHERDEVAAVAQHVAPRALPEPLVHRLRNIVHRLHLPSVIDRRHQIAHRRGAGEQHARRAPPAPAPEAARTAQAPSGRSPGKPRRRRRSGSGSRRSCSRRRRAVRPPPCSLPPSEAAPAALRVPRASAAPCSACSYCAAIACSRRPIRRSRPASPNSPRIAPISSTVICAWRVGEAAMARCRQRPGPARPTDAVRCRRVRHQPSAASFSR